MWKNYWRTEEISVVTNVNNVRDGPTVQLPHNEIVKATRTGNLPLAISLNTRAKNKHLFDGLQCASLISIGQLQNDYCIAILDQNEFNVLKEKTLILMGHRNKTDGLWYIPISRPVRHRALAIITRCKTKTEWIQYLRGCCFSPAPKTFPKAINNRNFLTWLGLKN